MHNHLLPAAALAELQPILELSKRAQLLVETHPSFIESLDEGAIATLPKLDPRKYQSDAVESFRKAYLNGETSISAEIGTGGGKTAIAFNFISRLSGKVLWLAPSNSALDRAVDEATNIGLQKKFQVLNGKGIDPTADIVFSTVGMLNSGAKFQQFDPSQFSLIVFDEGHHSMGKATRSLLDYFKSFHLYLTATPEMSANHLNRYAKPVFRYSSEDLIRHDKFPFWVLRRYEVTGETISNAQVIGGNYAIPEGEENQVLNMPHRYAITLQILKKHIPAGEKTIAFLPSVEASRKFVADIVSKHPELAGKVVHVDGKMDKRVVREIAKQFREGKILGVCCNDLFTESLDVPGIKHVILADPCCSPRVLMQRIGRGARPARDKTHLTIHDVISTVANLQDERKGTSPLTVAGALGVRKYAPDMVLNGPHRNEVLFHEAGQPNGKNIQFIDATTVTTEDISFHERLIDLSFMSRPELAYKIYQRFAESIDTSVANLILSGEHYAKAHPDIELELRFPARRPAANAEPGQSDAPPRTVGITFADALAATKLYQIEEKLGALLQQDLDHLCKSFHDMILAELSPEEKVLREIFAGKNHSNLPKKVPTDVIMGITPLQGTDAAKYARKMENLLPKFLQNANYLRPGIEKRRQSGMNGAHPIKLKTLIEQDTKYSYSWAKIVKYLNQFQDIGRQYETSKNQTYPFRVIRTTGGGFTFAKGTMADYEKVLQEDQKVHNDPDVSKLMLKTDVSFASWIIKFPHFIPYFELVAKALDRGDTVLQFTPEQIMYDSANFMLFLGIMAGDDCFACAEQYHPEFWISEEAHDTSSRTFLAVGIGHLKLEIENETAKPTTPEPTAKVIDFPAYRHNMIPTFLAVLERSKKLQPEGEMKHSSQRIHLTKLMEFGFDGQQNAEAWAKARMLFRRYHSLPAPRPYKQYPFLVRKNTAGFELAGETKTDLATCAKEWDAQIPDNDLVCRLIAKPPVYFAVIMRDFPHLKIYFELVAEALSQGIKILRFSPEQIKKDSDNFRLFLGMICGDPDLDAREPMWPEVMIFDGHPPGTEDLCVSIAHLKLEIENEPAKAAPDSLKAMLKSIPTTPDAAALASHWAKMTPIFQEVLRRSSPELDKTHGYPWLRKDQKMLPMHDLIAMDKPYAKIWEEVWKHLGNFWHHRRGHEGLRPSRLSLVRTTDNQFEFSQAVKEKYENILDGLGKTSPEEELLVTMSDFEFHSAYFLKKYPQLKVYFDLLAQALSEGVKILRFTPQQMMHDRENFILFLGLLSGDIAYGRECARWNDFIIYGDHPEGSPDVCIPLSYLKLELEESLTTTVVTKSPASPQPLTHEQRRAHRLAEFTDKFPQIFAASPFSLFPCDYIDPHAGVCWENPLSLDDRFALAADIPACVGGPLPQYPNYKHFLCLDGYASDLAGLPILHPSHQPILEQLRQIVADHRHNSGYNSNRQPGGALYLPKPEFYADELAKFIRMFGYNADDVDKNVAKIHGDSYKITKKDRGAAHFVKRPRRSPKDATFTMQKNSGNFCFTRQTQDAALYFRRLDDSQDKNATAEQTKINGKPQNYFAIELLHSPTLWPYFQQIVQARREHFDFITWPKSEFLKHFQQFAELIGILNSEAALEEESTAEERVRLLQPTGEENTDRIGLDISRLKIFPSTKDRVSKD